MRSVLTFCFFLVLVRVFAQEERIQAVQFSGYIEAYYNYDFNQPDDHLRPDFLYNFKRHNELSINLAMLRVDYRQEYIRAGLALMAGNYAQFNLMDEPAWAQLIYEASVGVRLAENFWLDVGIMPSHIGFESAIGADCWHLSRSLLAENSPYFLTGARFSYSLKEKTDFVIWMGNGWQNVQRLERNQSLSFGLQVNHRPLEGLELNYSNYFGNENPQPVRLNRFFNNLYIQYHIGDWGFLGGADFGIEDALFEGINQWYGATVSVRRSLGERFRLAGRAEYYSDPVGVILNEGLKVSGLSANLDYRLHPKSLVRLEFRQFYSDDPVFPLPAARFSQGNFALTGSLAVNF